MGKAHEYLAFMNSEFPFLQPLPKARHSDIAWEIAGYHASGICISVRCALDHPCPKGRGFDETLNAYTERHVKEKNGACITGHSWTVLTRDSIDARGGIIPDGGILTLTKLTNPRTDLLPLCTIIRGMTATLVDQDDMLDVRDVVHRPRVRAMEATGTTVTVTEVDDPWIPMTDVVDDEWYTYSDAGEVWSDVPDDDKMEL
jgi:hypothetical protein